MAKKRPADEDPGNPRPYTPLDLARWHCPDCGIYMSGFIAPDDREPRVCKGNARDDRGMCGGIMNEVFRERAA